MNGAGIRSRGALLPVLALSLTVIVWALRDERFRSAEGFLTGSITIPLAVSVAVVIVYIGWIARALTSAAWLALALISQAAVLQLVNAGTNVQYQHLLSIRDLVEGKRLIPTLILALQTALVGAAFRKLWSVARAGLKAFAAWQILVVAIFLFITGATFFRHAVAFPRELVLAAAIQVVALCNVVLAARSLPQHALQSFGEWSDRILGETLVDSTPDRGGIDRFAVFIAITVAVVAALLATFSYGRHPHVPDEVVYMLPAKYFAAGHLFLQPPPAAAAFELNLMDIAHGKWYSPVPPGWPAILAVGAFFGAMWLVNPILAGVNALLAYVFMREMYPRRTARLTLILLCASPWYVFLGMSLMTHMASLAAALVAAIAVARLVRTGRVHWALIGGAFIGLLSLIRPLEALLLAILLGLWSLRVSGWGRRVAAAVSLAASCIAVGALLLPYNKALTGSMWRVLMNDYIDAHNPPGANDLGFGANRGLGWPGLDPYPGHGIVDVFVNAQLNFSAINAELLGWATGSLILLAIVPFLRRLRTSDYMMLATVAGVAVIHSFFWFSGGPDFGARYWFLMILPCIALTVRAIEILPDRFASGSATRSQRMRLLAGVAAMSGMAIVTFIPWRAIDKYHHFRGMRPDVRELAREKHFGRSLVLIRGNRHPDYASAAAYNPVDLSGDEPVYAWARTPEIAAEARAAFPDRPVWVIDGPTITGRGFEISEEPNPSVTR